MLDLQNIYNFQIWTDEQKMLIDRFVYISSSITDTKLSTSRYSIRTTFANNLRCDFYIHKNNIGIVRFNRGAWIARNHHILGAIFDDINLVIAKIYISHLSDFDTKAIAMIMDQVTKMPKNIKYND